MDLGAGRTQEAGEASVRRGPVSYSIPATISGPFEVPLLENGLQFGARRRYPRGMRHLIILFALCLPTVPATAQMPEDEPVRTGNWHAWLSSPGGPLTFGLLLERGDSGYRGWLVNGKERSEIPAVRLEDDRLVLDFVQYNSVIRARPSATGNTLEGQWTRVSGPDETTVMDFRASWQQPRPEPPPEKRRGPGGIDKQKFLITPAMIVQGRWAVQFESSEDPAVAVFEVARDDVVTGTFLTTTGDYRFLGGTFANDRLELSAFDGAHAFLFIADLVDNNTLAGDFWSRDTWHEEWLAVRDPEAALPDAFGQTTWNDEVALSDLEYRDLDGNLVSPADEKFAGKARIIEVFGTWCPNCNDATKYLTQLHRRYADQGLSILGLAFEMTGDPEEDAAQVRRYVEYHGIEWPILIAGTSDKTEATKAFPVLDEVRSYPTFIFLDGQGKVEAIYTGFNGPATGPAYDKLRTDFERIIEGMLEE